VIPLAVAANKFPRGVETPGTRLHGKRGTPACRPGEPATYDWRAPLGSAENTACIEPAFAVNTYDAVLSDVYPTDAHFVAYVLYQAGVKRQFQNRQPRINKASLEWIESLGFELRMEVFVADVDNPDHAGWPSEAAARMTAELAHTLLRTACIYVTAHGLRVVQPLDGDGVGIRSAERHLRVWLSDLEGRLERLRLQPDWSCDDWTRLFRAPHVLRDGKPYRSPAVLPSTNWPALAWSETFSVRSTEPRRSSRSRRSTTVRLSL
jgi:hypothetical protein